MLRSEGGPYRMLTTLLNRYALPCWPRKDFEVLVGCCADGIMEKEGRVLPGLLYHRDQLDGLYSFYIRRSFDC